MISKHDFASQIMASFIGWIPRGASRSLALMAGLSLMCRTFCFVLLLRLRLDGINKTSTVTVLVMAIFMGRRKARKTEKPSKQ